MSTFWGHLVFSETTKVANQDAPQSMLFASIHKYVANMYGADFSRIFR